VKYIREGSRKTGTPPGWPEHELLADYRGASWCILCIVMTAIEKPVRRSISLPPSTARRVRSLAESSHTSANRILVELIETGLEAREQEKKRFFALADRLTSARDPDEQSRLKEKLAHMTFGE